MAKYNYIDYSADTEKLKAYNFYMDNNFKAREIVNNDDFLIFDWRGADSGNLSSRYIIDKKKGTFIVTGDADDCIASWYHNVSPEDIFGYVHDVNYFIEKLQVSCPLYVFDADLAEKDFKKMISEAVHEEHENLIDFVADVTCADPASIQDEVKYIFMNDFRNEMQDVFDTICDLHGTECLSDIVDFNMSKWFGDVWGEWLPVTSAGLKLSNRVFLWTVGYQMAYTQLFEGTPEIPVENYREFYVVASPYANVEGTLRVPDGEDPKEYSKEHFDEIEFGIPSLDYHGIDIDLYDENDNLVE